MRLDNIKYESKKLTIKRYLDGEIWRGSYCVTAVWFFFFSLSSLSSYLKKKVDDLCKRRVFRHLRAFWLRPSYQRGETALGIRSPLLTPPPPPPAAAKLSFIIVTIPKVVRKGKHLEAVWRASKEKKKTVINDDVGPRALKNRTGLCFDSEGKIAPTQLSVWSRVHTL